MSKMLTPMSKLPRELQEQIRSGSTRTTCPECSGGSSNERSLSISPWLDQFVKLKCWRSTCGYWTAVVVDNDVTRAREAIASQAVRQVGYKGAYAPLDPVGEWANTLKLEYRINPQQCIDRGWKETDDGDLVIAVLGPAGESRGHIIRSVYGNGKKRVYNYPSDANVPFTDWHLVPDEIRPMFIVEDSLSAARARACGFHAISLNGTNLTHETVEEIVCFEDANPVYLALDNDMWDKTLTLAQRYAYKLRLHPVLLPMGRDIKSMSMDEVRVLAYAV
jgi:hypothetical protein